MEENTATIIAVLTVLIGFGALYLQNKKAQNEIGEWKGRIEERVEGIHAALDAHETHCHERTQNIYGQLKELNSGLSEMKGYIRASQHDEL